MAEICCEMCGRMLDRLDTQYIATIEIRPTVGAVESDEEPGDRDHLMELHEMLERAADEDCFDPVEESAEPTEFTLCGECCRRFSENPLQRELAHQLDFSEN